MVRLLVCLVLAAYIMVCQGSLFEWRANPYGDDHPFNTEAEFGTNATLTCDNYIYNDTTKITVEYWITPDLRVLRPGNTSRESTLEGYMSWEVSDSGMEITLVLINPLHFGFYYCVADYDTETVVVKKGLNYLGPYFGDLWEKYEMSVIIGCSAVGAVLLLLAIACLIDYFFCPKRSPDEKEWKMRHHNEDDAVANHGHENGGFSADGPDDVESENPKAASSRDEEAVYVIDPPDYSQVTTQF